MGLSAGGCGFSGENCDILLPCRNLYVPVPPGWRGRFSFEARGVAEFGPLAVHRSLVVDGLDSFEPVDRGLLPSDWVELAGVTTFRGAPLAHFRLYPVCFRGGSPLLSSTIDLSVETDGAGPPSRMRGAEEALFRAVAGTDLAWREASRPTRAASPFLGLPWARISVDTAGVYLLTGSDIPWALGAPSATLAMSTGRGRPMGSQPWDSLYSPRAVPISVRDGGDGSFDLPDSVVFFARGLSWWEPVPDSMPQHYMHPWSGTNRYWLTWGAEPGLRMQVFDAGLTGAPAMPQRFLGRLHFEQDYIRKPGLVAGDWVWDAALGSGTQWFYHPFDLPGQAGGAGILRIFLVSTEPGAHRIRLLVNDTPAADTTWTGTAPFVLQTRVDGLTGAGDMLACAVIHNESSDDVYMDWFEVFPSMTPSSAGLTHVPLEWFAGPDRFRIDWQGSLDGSLAFLVGGDTLAAELDLDPGSSFEVEPPHGWPVREIWIAPQGTLLEPAAVEYAEPGGLLGLPHGADRIYIVPEDYLQDAGPLVEPGSASEIVTLESIFDELNGGVRDPSAVRAFLDIVLGGWSPVPVEVILCGNGHFDPRNRISSRPSLIDPLPQQGDIFTDDAFAVTSGVTLPQFAMSRICTADRNGFAIAAQRLDGYRAREFPGTWQTIVLGAADDERSSKHSADETYHTEGVERILEDHLPQPFRPVKHYLIFYDWNDMWKKPEARQDYIARWSEGALLSIYLGHGGFDQLADEGLLYIEDVGLLACDNRLPVAFFGSCRVGEFQDPARDCLAQSVITAPAGGAIAGIGATMDTSGPLNEMLAAAFTDNLLPGAMSVGSALLAAKIQAGYSVNNMVYNLFGDGSTMPAVPGAVFGMSADTLRTGEVNTVSGSAPAAGLLLLEAWESCRPDTYFTFRQHLAIPYMAPGGRFYTGSAAAGPGFSLGVFVPVDADTGGFARVSAFLLQQAGSAASSTYPHPLGPGDPSPSDTAGPVMELWIDGFRNVPDPVVTGEVTVQARLSDPSGIYLLGNPGRQLALYVDGAPRDVSGDFSYDRGSTTEGTLSTGLGILQQGGHLLELRASDCLLNRSTISAGFTVVAGGEVAFSGVFAYPCPASDGVSLNWTQSGAAPVDIRIYAVSGRRLAEFRNIPGQAGYNQYWWDCTDADGDPVASGAYVFRLSSGDSGVTGILAVAR